jgi:membrane carboxypeptidase/penicillin-binding protein
MGYLVSGTTGAAPIWNRIMTKVLENKAVKNFTRPTGVITMNVCNLTGQLAPEGGCDSHNELFKKEFTPKLRISLQNNILVDKTTNQIVKEGEDNPNAEWQSKQSVQDVTGEWVCLDCPKDEENN